MCSSGVDRVDKIFKHTHTQVPLLDAERESGAENYIQLCCIGTYVIHIHINNTVRRILYAHSFRGHKEYERTRNEHSVRIYAAGNMTMSRGRAAEQFVGASVCVCVMCRTCSEAHFYSTILCTHVCSDSPPLAALVRLYAEMQLKD